jgi:glycosyltransferase involved in cell wall biosynthesis
MWICSQIGAREHYAIPLALHKAGRLATLYTDFWAGRALRRTQEMAGGRWKLGALRALAGRYHPELDASRERKVSGQWSVVSGRSALVQSWNLRSLWWEGILRRKQKSGNQKAEIGGQGKEVRGQRSEVRGPYHGFVEVGRRFAERVREDLKRRNDLGLDTIFFGYDTGSLETMEWCRERGIKCVLNQMDPNRVEVDLVRSEAMQWPGWALEDIKVPEAYFARREREWALADRVVVNSEFSRQALLRQGVPSEKLAVVPLCFEREELGDRRWEMGDGKAESRDQKLEVGSQKSEPLTLNSQLSTEPLRVLFLGQVILRKGIQYLLAAARKLERENIHFDVVGSVGISREAVATAPDNVTFHGRTGRDQTTDWYRKSHVFVLPTLSDGFAITQLEAMAHGLPVITTPCCGEVVSEGMDGFIVPPRNPDALVMALQRYLSEPGLLQAQRRAALEKSKQFTLGRLAENLRRVEEGLTC